MTHVLVVDDDPVLADLVAFRLGRLGLEVSVEADGEERDWRAGGLTPDAVRALLSGRTGTPMVLRDLPDARLAGKQAALDLLDRGAVATVGELSEAPLTVAARPGGPADPAELAAIAAEAGFDTYVRQSLSDEVGLVEAAAADNVKRVVKLPPGERSPQLITAFMEMKTIWHPIGV